MNGSINKFYCKEELAGITRGCFLFLFFASSRVAPARIGAWLIVIRFSLFFLRREQSKKVGEMSFWGIFKDINRGWGVIMVFACVVLIKRKGNIVPKHLGFGHRIIQLCFACSEDELQKWVTGTTTLVMCNKSQADHDHAQPLPALKSLSQLSFQIIPCIKKCLFVLPNSDPHHQLTATGR